MYLGSLCLEFIVQIISLIVEECVEKLYHLMESVYGVL